MAAARISLEGSGKIQLGNLEARRDWGYAPDYVRAMHAILNHDKPEDFVVATGMLHSVADLCEAAFSHVGLDWKAHVETNPAFYRTEEGIPLCGCAEKIEREVGWRPQTDFAEMVRRMVDADLSRVSAAR
jgi:GDPmannose 4,6-dehydratase